MNRVVALLFMLAGCWAFCDDTNVVFRDDFEAASVVSPPPGWTMYAYKVNSRVDFKPVLSDKVVHAIARA